VAEADATSVLVVCSDKRSAYLDSEFLSLR